MENKELKNRKEREIAEMLKQFENLGAYQKGIVIGYTRGLSEALHIPQKSLKIS